MFSGIITEVGKVVKIEPTKNGFNLSLSTNYDLTKINLGDSICCNGCCLTVTAINTTNKTVTFFVSSETIAKSNFKDLKEGDKVNMEQSISMYQGLHGGITLGHVDCTGTVTMVKEDGDLYILKILIKDLLVRRCVAYKGTLTINGVALTVNNLEDDTAQRTTTIELGIIPHSWKNTNLSALRNNSIVNIEVDSIARYIDRQMSFII